LVEQKWTYTYRRGPGRPRTIQVITQLNGKYNQARDPSNLKSVYGTTGSAIMDQIEADAAERFLMPKLPF
jgi:hypothetical protein